MGRRLAITIVTAVLLVMGLSGVALAVNSNYFPPIYNDYAADRDLDGTYTRAELEAYLNNAEVDQYGDPDVVLALDALVRQMLQQYTTTTLHGPPPPPDTYDPSLPWRHATPQQIYDDYAEDGHFDWNYYDADILAYLNDAFINQYCDPATIAEIDALLTRLLQVKRTTASRDSFPLTGASFALMILGAAGLAGAGFGLRRLAGRNGSA